MRILNGLLVLALCFSGAAKADDAVNTTVLPSTTQPTTVVTSTETTAAETTVTPTVVPTTTAASTTTEPTPSVGNWTVHEGNITCIMAVMEVGFQNLVGREKEVYLSPSASANRSTCDNTTANLVLQDKHLDITLTLTFTKKSSETYVSNISIIQTSGENKTDGEYFKATSQKSYKCNSDEKITIENVTATFSNVQLQAFDITGEKFGDAVQCSDDETSELVPIIVAAALGAMVVIILISYVVFRRQSRQRGYESV